MREDLYKAVELVIERRVVAGKLSITLNQLQELMPGEEKEALKEVMRQLARSGRYKAGLTVNKIPMIRRKNMSYKIKKGQYFYGYSPMYKCYKIYKASEDSEDIRKSGSGSTVWNEPSYETQAEARQRVKELNGWN